MKRNLLIALLFLTACKTAKLPPERHETTEIVRTQYIEKLRDTTIYIFMPAEVRERFTPDSTSFLELSHAQSTCEIRDGLLYHSLETKPVEIPIDVTVKDTYQRSDSIRIEYRDVPYPVPAEFTKWQKFYMSLGRIVFWVIISTVLVGLIIGGRKIWRKIKRGW